MRASCIVRAFAALGIGVVLSIGGCASPSKPQPVPQTRSEALSHFSLGLLAEADGDSAAALEHLQTAIRLDPQEPKLYAPAVALAVQLGKTEEAVRLAEEQRRQIRDGTGPDLLLARIYALTGRTSEAEKLFRSVIAKDPADPDAPVFFAQMLLSLERRDEALDVLQTAATTQADNAELLQLLGVVYLESSHGKEPADAEADLRDGIAFLEMALTAAPQNPLCWQHLGMAYLRVHEPNKALIAFREARAYAPSDLLLARLLFDTLLQTGDYDGALAIYDRLAEETGSDPEQWLQYFGESLPKNEQSRLTLHLETQLREQPAAPVFCYVQLASIHIGARRLDEAQTVLNQGLANFPDDIRLLTARAYLRLQQERYDESYDEFDKIYSRMPVANGPLSPFFTLNFLMAAQKSGRQTEAVELLVTVYTHQPEVASEYMMALVSGEAKIPADRATELLKAFHSRMPETVEPLYYLMFLLANQNDYPAALETARQFMDLAQRTEQTHLFSGAFYYQYAALHERTGDLENAERIFLKAIDSGDAALAAASENYVAYMWAERGERRVH
jgi:tetratricopeptide (TPR) repeat protein